MKRLLVFFFISTCCLSPLWSQTDFFELTNVFLSKYAKNGLVQYADIKKNQQELDELIRLVGDYKVSAANEDIQKAFYINAYNLLVIESIVKFFPVSSPLKIPGFFQEANHLIAGEKFSLNELEKEKILKNFNDPRVHFVLVCGAKGCPPMLGALMPDKLSDQLDKACKRSINNDEFIRVEKFASKAAISEIFKWYKDDFGGSDERILQFINQYRDTQIPSNYKIWYYTYDWALNSPYN